MKAVFDVKLEEFFNSFSLVICHAVLIVNNDLISVELYTRFYNHFFSFFLFFFSFFKRVKMFLTGFFSIGTGFHRSPVIILIPNQLVKIPFYSYGSLRVKADCTPPHVTSTYMNGIKMKLKLKKGQPLENNKKLPVFLMW